MNNNLNNNENPTSNIEINNSKKTPDYGKYLNIVLIALLIFVGVNRFVLPALGTGNGNLSKIGLEYYVENYGTETGTEGIKSVVQNYGCHQEIHIFKDGELIMRLSYFNGKVYEL